MKNKKRLRCHGISLILMALSMPSMGTSQHAVVALGGYWSHSGKAQHINIQGLIGDTFTVTDPDDSNGLVGLGYFIEGLHAHNLSLPNVSYGVQAFYLPRTSVGGNVVQENLFTNLSYVYTETHIPLYAMAKSKIKLKSDHYALNIDAGIGPNFMKVDGFQENSLDGGVTLPDNIFSGRTNTTLSATAGVAISVAKVFGEAPLECGYRFFYLGQGHLKTTTTQVLNTLNTGSTYANAAVCSIIV